MGKIRSVRFLADYRGVLSGEMFHAKGSIVSEATPPALLQVDKLIKEKRAELVEEGSEDLSVAAKPKRKSAPKKKVKK